MKPKPVLDEEMELWGWIASEENRTDDPNGALDLPERRRPRKVRLWERAPEQRTGERRAQRRFAMQQEGG